MNPVLIDGKEVAAKVREGLQKEIEVIAVGNLGGEHAAAKEDVKQKNGGPFHKTLMLVLTNG